MITQHPSSMGVAQERRERAGRSSAHAVVPMSQREVARKFGITRTRVYQIESRALWKLRVALLRDPLIIEWLKEHRCRRSK